jgi:hypothetical protein
MAMKPQRGTDRYEGKARGKCAEREAGLFTSEPEVVISANDGSGTILVNDELIRRVQSPF